jgi:hypothetical protein
LDQAIEANMSKGMNRDRAVKAAFKADATLQQRVIEEANENRSNLPPRRAA